MSTTSTTIQQATSLEEVKTGNSPTTNNISQVAPQDSSSSKLKKGNNKCVLHVGQNLTQEKILIRKRKETS
jgi:hypothetical protein